MSNQTKMMTEKKAHKRSRLKILALGLVCLLPVTYTFAVLSFVFSHVWDSGLEGGGNGPADAYRHSLSSALVAHTLSPHVVTLVTNIMERSNNPANVMDRHNNLLGAQVGASIPLSFNSIKTVNKVIRQRVDNAAVNTLEPNQITLMPKSNWVERRFH